MAGELRPRAQSKKTRQRNWLGPWRGRRQRRQFGSVMGSVLMLGALTLPALASGIDGANAHLVLPSLPSLATVRGDFSAAWAWLTGASSPSPWGRLPAEPSGSAAGHPHEVPAAATRANRGNGHGCAEHTDHRERVAPAAPCGPE